MALDPNRLESLISTLTSRPGHETVRSLVRELCVVGLDVPDREIDFEVPIPMVRGRIDALLGDTIFEFKRDLRRESGQACEQLERYLSERERVTGRRYLGIATDGASFVAYELRGGQLERLDEHIPNVRDPRSLLRWLDTAISVNEDLFPDPESVRSELGRDSLVCRRAMASLRELWSLAQHVPEAALKRDLWSRHLEFVYGTLIDPEELFLQHTYLTIVAKTMAVRTLTDGRLNAPEILAGTPFTNIGLHGAVDTDFFDWLGLVAGGSELTERIVHQVCRFSLSSIDSDTLKSLYESLIDPRQRHYLGEYFTPDWLADWMVKETITDPLSTRVLDPSCGSGTFLFHAVRHYVAAAEAAGQSIDETLAGCVAHIAGIDVHPISVLFARVTYLMALGRERLSRRTCQLHVPVYLGDSLQWNVEHLLNSETVDIPVPGEPPLRFPGSVAARPGQLDAILGYMNELCSHNAPSRAMAAWLNAHHNDLPKADRAILSNTYKQLNALHQAGRNHIWSYVVSNLTRPLWLSARSERASVLIGNPPWLKFNAMSRAMQNSFKGACKDRGLWVGGKLATQQDLSAYFFARSAERYLNRDGRIAYVMPLASLSRGQYAPFLRGRFLDKAGLNGAIVRFDGAWVFDSDVRPLLPVPSTVLFAHRSAATAPLPQGVTRFKGNLPCRDASSAQARVALQPHQCPWPTAMTGTVDGGSPYRDDFRQGSTILPRRLFLVRRLPIGRLGTDAENPPVESRRGTYDKEPWRSHADLRGPMERRFLKPVLLGESILPYRQLTVEEAVIPWSDDAGGLMDASTALDAGYVHLSTWLRRAEALWNEHGTGQMALSDRLDYHGSLTVQFPIQPIRVVYTKSGATLAAAVVRDSEAIIDHKLYWTSCYGESEAHYLAAILNSDTSINRIRHLQSRGHGPRDFDKIIFALPFPRFSADIPLHLRIAECGKRAEARAMETPLREGMPFPSARQAIRKHLAEAGIAKQIEDDVSQLLNGAT